MSASRKTENFNLPLYNADDATSWLVDFNGAMGELENHLTEMRNNLTTDGEDLDNLEKAVANLNKTTSQLTDSVIKVQETGKSNSSAITLLQTHDNEQDSRLTNLESVEELINAINSKIQKLNSYVPEFIHRTNVSYSLNSASENNISKPDIKIETVTYEIYRKHDIYFSFDYRTTQEISHNMELSFADIEPIHELLYNSKFIGKCAVTATGYTSGGNVMPMSANIGVRNGRLVIIFTGSDNIYLPDNSDSHITVHITGFTIRSDI